MKRNVFQKWIMTLAIAALILTGAAPSFAITEQTDAGYSTPATVQSLQKAAVFEDAPKLKAESAILIDASTKAILFAEDEHQKRDPASMTKILNLITVINQRGLDGDYTIEHSPEWEGTVLNLEIGETIPIKELAYGMMLESGNDAAQAIAYATSGSISDFCDLMNETAAEYGALNTKYVNPNGLNPNPVNNVTTAYDIAMVSAIAMDNPDFRKIVSTVRHKIPATNKSKARKLHNTNVCLWMTKEKAKKYNLKKNYKIEGCTGIKTGFSSSAGYCVCCSAKRGGTELIAVIMGEEEEFGRFTDAKKLLKYGFKHYETITVHNKSEAAGSVKIRRGEKAKADVGINRDLCVTAEKGYDADNIETDVVFTDKKIDAPVTSGKVVGSLIARDGDGNELAREDLITLESSAVGGPLSTIGIADEELPMFYGCCVAAAILILLFILHRARRRRSGVMSKRQRRKARKKRRKQERKDKERNV